MGFLSILTFNIKLIFIFNVRLRIKIIKISFKTLLKKFLHNL